MSEQSTPVAQKQDFEGLGKLVKRSTPALYIVDWFLWITGLHLFIYSFYQWNITDCINITVLFIVYGFLLLVATIILFSYAIISRVYLFLQFMKCCGFAGYLINHLIQTGIHQPASYELIILTVTPWLLLCWTVCSVHALTYEIETPTSSPVFKTDLYSQAMFDSPVTCSLEPIELRRGHGLGRYSMEDLFEYEDCHETLS